MKMTIEVPDGTGAMSVTYVYDDGNVHRIGTELLDTRDIEEQRESQLTKSQYKRIQAQREAKEEGAET